MIKLCKGIKALVLLNIFWTVPPNSGFAKASEMPPDLQRAKVILAGEMHYFTPIESYEYLFQEFSMAVNGTRCLAIEVPKTEKPLAEVLRGLQQGADYFSKRPEPEAHETAKSLNMFVSYLGKIGALAEKFDLKIQPVEHFDKLNLNLSIDERNKAIAENINDLLVSGKCDRILGIFGKAHLSVGMMRTTSIQQLLEAYRVVAPTINIQMTNEEGLPELYKGFADSRMSAPTAFTWILNKDLEQNIRLLPNVPDENSTWQQFTHSLLIPRNLNPIAY